MIVTTILQIWPQIYQTYVQKTAGSISLLTQAIQCPGNLLVVLFQISSGTTWTVWLPFLNAGAQQLLLCSLIVWYDYMPCNKERREEKKREKEEKESSKEMADQEISESSGLLNGGNEYVEVI